MQPDDKDVISSTENPASSSNDSADPSRDLSLEFVHLQHLLGRVATQLDAESLAADAGRPNASNDVVFITVLKYMMASGRQSMGLDLPQQVKSYSKALRRVTECIEVLDSVTVKGQLAQTLTSCWSKLPDLVERHLSRQEIEAFKSCRKEFAGSVVNLKGDTGSAADMSSVVDDIFRLYMNRTLKIVSELSQTVQTTLDRVRTLPEELFAENKTAKKIGRKMTEAVNKLNSKVQSGWKHVASKFEDIRKKWFGYHESKKMCKYKNREEKKNKQTTKSTDDDKVFPGKPFTKSDEKVEDKKRSYKQTESAPTGKEDAKYGPGKPCSGDFMHSIQLDDFFEDNHRAWRREHNRRLRKLAGRFERLNEEMYLSMDDDDVEDIYEDLKDFGEVISIFCHFLLCKDRNCSRLLNHSHCIYLLLIYFIF